MPLADTRARLLGGHLGQRGEALRVKFSVKRVFRPARRREPHVEHVQENCACEARVPWCQRRDLSSARHVVAGRVGDESVRHTFTAAPADTTCRRFAVHAGSAPSVPAVRVVHGCGAMGHCKGALDNSLVTHSRAQALCRARPAW